MFRIRIRLRLKVWICVRVRISHRTVRFLRLHINVPITPHSSDFHYLLIAIFADSPTLRSLPDDIYLAVVVMTSKSPDCPLGLDVVQLVPKMVNCRQLSCLCKLENCQKSNSD